MRKPEQATTARYEGSEDETAQQSRTLVIAVAHGPDLSREVSPLSKERALTIGRDVSRGLRVADPRLSRSHLRIAWDPLLGVYRHADLESANGTRVNGVPVREGVLNDNDVIRIGDTLLVCFDPERDRTDAFTSHAARSTLPVLILGETGCGKERLARAIHSASTRSGPFVAVNTAALPRELVASELFGHTRGAFSGAGAVRAGLFRAADGGTLFLDEIGEMPTDVQPVLLRALEDHCIRPVGSDAEIRVDVRIIAATNVSLETAVSAGEFREDLLARLAHLVVRLRPLRNARERILPLVREFAPELTFSAGAAEALLLQNWPRNVRELRATVESVRVLCPEARPVRLRDLQSAVPGTPAFAQSAGPADGSRPAGASFREALLVALERNAGNVTAAARELGKPRSHVYRWLEQLGLKAEAYRK